VLLDNGGNQLTVTTSGTFPFTTKIAAGGAYAVTVKTQPATQLCAVTGVTPASGVASANTTVTFTCTNQYTISAMVNTLNGTGLVLWDNNNIANDALAVSSSGTSSFTKKIAAGGAYAVTVHAQPTAPVQLCAVTGATPASGVANADTTVTFTCTNQYTISATVTGLTGTNLVLQDNGADNLTFTGNGTFPFATKVAAAGPYAVTVFTQPTGSPTQYCIPISGSGTASGAVAISVSCKNVGQVVFSANPYDNSGTGTIGDFTIASSNGALTQVGLTPAFIPAATDNNPLGLAVDPTGPYLYVANAGTFAPPAGNDVATFTIGAGGTLLEGTPVTISATNDPLSVGVDPLGPYLYVGSNDTAANGAMEAFAPVAGVLGTEVGSPAVSGNEPFSLSVDSADAAVIEANDGDDTVRVYGIGAGGGLTEIGNSPFGPGIGGTGLVAPLAVATYPTGTYVYITDLLHVPATAAGTVNVFTYSATGGGGGGSLTPVGAYAVGIDPEGVTIDPTGQFLYVSNAHNGTVSGFTIAAGTGLLTPILGSPFTATTTHLPSLTPTGLAVDPSSQFLYVANGTDSTITVFSIAPATGALTAVGTPTAATNGLGAGTTAVAVQ